MHLAYLRLPGRVLGAVEIPLPDMLAFIARQLGIAPEICNEYARRGETRWEHLSELQAYLKVLRSRAKTTGPWRKSLWSRLPAPIEATPLSPQ
jgi:Domain of unknown function (DUF4158)